jgi:hypothetical protein
VVFVVQVFTVRCGVGGRGMCCEEYALNGQCQGETRSSQVAIGDEFARRYRCG